MNNSKTHSASKQSIEPKRIILSRTDSIGDVILTLPMAGVLKANFPNIHITFLGKNYTEPIIKACEHVDDFLDWSELENLSQNEQIDRIKETGADTFIHVFPRRSIAKVAKKAGIPHRIGTGRRWYHLLTCNQRILLKRKSSNLHEAQLNLKLLSPFGINTDISKEEIPEYYGLTKVESLAEEWKKIITPDKFNLLLHPRSKGSAVEWGIGNFAELIRLLPKEKFEIFITGTEEEGMMIRDELPLQLSNVHDLTGRINLYQLTSFINEADGLIAASTGPLHIASALGKLVFGLFAPRRPIHPERWAPLGKNANTVVYDENCPTCKAGKDCQCIWQISPEYIKECLTEKIETVAK